MVKIIGWRSCKKSDEKSIKVDSRNLFLVFFEMAGVYNPTKRPESLEDENLYKDLIDVFTKKYGKSSKLKNNIDLFYEINQSFGKDLRIIKRFNELLRISLQNIAMEDSDKLKNLIILEDREVLKQFLDLEKIKSALINNVSDLKIPEIVQEGREYIYTHSVENTCFNRFKNSIAACCSNLVATLVFCLKLIGASPFYIFNITSSILLIRFYQEYQAQGYFQIFEQEAPELHSTIYKSMFAIIVLDLIKSIAFLVYLIFMLIAILTSRYHSHLNSFHFLLFLIVILMFSLFVLRIIFLTADDTYIPSFLEKIENSYDNMVNFPELFDRLHTIFCFEMFMTSYFIIEPCLFACLATHLF